MAVAKEGNITPPSWPADEFLKIPKPMPSSSPNTIPPNTRIKPFAGLPASTGPSPMKIEGH